MQEGTQFRVLGYGLTGIIKFIIEEDVAIALVVCDGSTYIFLNVYFYAVEISWSTTWWDRTL